MMDDNVEIYSHIGHQGSRKYEDSHQRVNSYKELKLCFISHKNIIHWWVLWGYAWMDFHYIDGHFLVTYNYAQDLLLALNLGLIPGEPWEIIYVSKNWCHTRQVHSSLLSLPGPSPVILMFINIPILPKWMCMHAHTYTMAVIKNYWNFIQERKNLTYSQTEAYYDLKLNIQLMLNSIKSLQSQ